MVYRLGVLAGHGADVKCLDWHPRKSLLVSGSKDNQQPVKLWDPKSGQSVCTLLVLPSTFPLFRVLELLCVLLWLFSAVVPLRVYYDTIPTRKHSTHSTSFVKWLQNHRKLPKGEGH